MATCIVFGLAAGILARPVAAALDAVEELRTLSLEDLARLDITSVFKRPEPLNQAPAAVYVITGEEIRRSGATSLPEALRLAPNLHVARVSSRSYAISARGFNSFEAANKLLVMIDGRSIYTAVHGGVFWEDHDVMLDDVERIEVVSGPGGTLWGANAFNGVINIITKSAHDTQGGLATLQLGTLDQNVALRYGGMLDENTALRVYGQGFDRGDLERPDGSDADDGWDRLQGGFRLDWTEASEGLTVQGDLFDSSGEEDDWSGGNLRARWTRRFEDGSGLQLQAYYDRLRRSLPGLDEKVDAGDISAQHDFTLGERHGIVWGGGYRYTEDTFDTGPSIITVKPVTRDVHVANLFVQDSIALASDLTLIAGTKLEWNSFTDLEILPSVRLAWQVSPDMLLWTAVSRAVRTPTRIDHDLQSPGLIDPAVDFRSEEVIAYEIGYRGQPTADTTLSVSLYYNDYDDLRALSISPDTGLLIFGNKMHGHGYGLEAWGDWQAAPWWRLGAGVNLMEKDLELEPGAVDLALDQHQGNDPEYQLFLRSQMDLTDDVELNVGLRAIDDLPQPDVPGYVELDARLGWHVTDRLELSVAGLNLLHDRHPETGHPAARTEVPRSVYVGARWRF
ncbi:MAG: hypothetical protein BroJett029_40870 [Alphaproteobacteria bacterium]|nr:MAG: hypothetical protein BroJett029_40870 [Alphaproteobacteria bacterium]